MDPWHSVDMCTVESGQTLYHWTHGHMYSILKTAQCLECLLSVIVVSCGAFQIC